ncbi:regulatory protein RecX [Phytoactinopolyspora mesophila]|uniref:Regulatory protein RecX n=1 Tax=Phytoactinopolyspora mesophila TaxID=2650750 RepID=A0A7K3M7J2_9ACTN|nr:regulatory protein RecX [Phytoactinopolyspora mesophila]NDL59234.1 RecX family transcriptional regulator [Phytoactinopolyspora mesophila]
MSNGEHGFSDTAENPESQLDEGSELADPESVARSVALRRLAAAPQTRAQLDQAMKKKGVPEDVRDRVLDRFSEVKLVDDAAFAAAWVESRHTGRGLARRALSHELRQRGVSPGVVEQAVEAVPAEQEEQMARDLVVKRLAGTRRLDPAARSRRLISMLGRKGYPAGLAYRVVREMLESEGVDESSMPPEPLEE